MTTIPLSEILTDLAETEKDIAHLSAIILHLRGFIEDTDEDRSRYRAELFTFRGLLSNAERLRDTIVAAKVKAEAQEPPAQLAAEAGIAGLDGQGVATPAKGDA